MGYSAEERGMLSVRLGERAELVCTPDVDGLQVYGLGGTQG